jgi:transposase-like protein
MTEEDYPLNQQEFEARFSTEEACFKYLFVLRWPNGFVCPRCMGRSHWLTRKGLIVCSVCQHHASVTAGTIFQDTRKPLQLWFRAAWFVTQQKQGASALGLQRALGLGGYLTAWTWLHKFRRAMVRPNRDRLSGCVEVDETLFGGLEEGHKGRNAGKKAFIAVAAEADGKGIGRIRMSHLLDVTTVSLNGFVESVVAKGTTIHTDGWAGYNQLGERGYLHVAMPLQHKPKLASKLLPRVHRVISLFKRWMLGTHQGAVSHEQLAYYLDEFTFRFNRRKSKHRGKLFFRLMQQAVAHEPAPFSVIAASQAQ